MPHSSHKTDEAPQFASWPSWSLIIHIRLCSAPISSPSPLAPCSFLLTWDIAFTEAQLTDGVCSRNCHAIVEDQIHIKRGKGKDLQTQADCKRWGPEIPHQRQYESLVPRLRYFKVQPWKIGCGWGGGGGDVMINNFWFGKNLAVSKKAHLTLKQTPLKWIK